MPGTIHPTEAPRDDPARSELRVFDALRAALPDGWTAWHSVRVRDRENVVRECDFVVASPEFGLLVLEVKGGNVRIDGQRLRGPVRLYFGRLAARERGPSSRKVRGT